jgi:serine/threonine-protein kinase
VDKRADIWAFGVVLYEMLSGKRAFEGDDVSVTLASVLKDDVDWKALPAELPPSVMRVLRRCLEKDPKRRLSAIGDARLELDEAAMRSTEGHSSLPPAQRAKPSLLPWAIALVGVTAAGAAFAVWGPWRPSRQVAPVRVSGEVGADITLAVSEGASAVLSRDGQTVVFVGVAAQNLPALYVRPLSQLQATLLPGTEGAYSPFFSPDGKSIAFFVAGALKKVAVTGGAPTTICAVQGGRGGWWNDDNTIVFQPSGGTDTILHRVSADGGKPAPIGVQAPNETTQRWPQALPGGRGVLYTGNDGSTVWDNSSIMVQPLDGSTPKPVRRGGYQGRYVASGHLLYMRESTLYAVPFDLDRLEAAGDAVSVVEGVLGAANTGGVQFSVADNGTLVYLVGRTDGPDERIYTMEASGKTTVLRAQAAEWFNPRYSHDGTKLAITIRKGPDADIWIHEPDRDLARLTSEPGGDFAPVWTPNGDRIAFASTRGDSGPVNMYWRRSNGTGGIERLTRSSKVQVPYSFHRSGRELAFTERNTVSLTDIMILPLEGDDKAGWKPGTPRPFLDTPAHESSPAFSPDGKWLAYQSNETGTFEIYVCPFPSGDDKKKISSGGGLHPRWSANKNELFYLGIDSPNPVMVVPYQVDGDNFVPGAPKQWSTQRIQPHPRGSAYDVHPGGLRIVMSKPPDVPAARRDKAVFVFNFFDELRRVAPRK